MIMLSDASNLTTKLTDQDTYSLDTGKYKLLYDDNNGLVRVERITA